MADTIVLALIGGAWLGPLLWLLAVSLGSPQGDLSLGPGLDNYRYLWDHGQLGPIWNSTVIGVSTGVLAVPAGFLVAYEAQQARAAPLLWTLVLYKAVPASALAIAAFGLARFMALPNSMLLPLMLIVLSNLFLAVLLVFVALRRLPRRLFDAMRVDGLSPLQQRLTVASLVRAELLAVFILMFLLAWGEGFLTGVLTPHGLRPLSAEMMTFTTSFGAYWGRLAALSAVSLVPCLLVGPLLLAMMLRLGERR